MPTDNGVVELYRKYRPARFKDVLGQPAAVKLLRKLIEDGFPHALMLTGPSGVGKTTLARIVRRALGCGEREYREINAADCRGIDDVRRIKAQMGLRAVSGSCWVYVFDEAHRITAEAQDALLKMLEDTPSHVYFFLLTTNPNKLAKTIRTRCVEVRLGSVPNKEIRDLILDAWTKESGNGVGIDDKLVGKIVEKAQGSARKALVLLGQALRHGDVTDQLQAVECTEEDKQAFDIAKALFNGDPWSKVAALLKEVTEDHEKVRHVVLGYAASVLLGGGGPKAGRAMQLLQVFRDAWHECGRPMLVACCYEVCQIRV